MRVHDKRPARGDGLVDGLARQQEHLRVGLGRGETQHVSSQVHQRDALWVHGLCLLADRDGAAAHEHDGVVALGHGHVEGHVFCRDSDIEELHRRVRRRGAFHAVGRLVPGDDADRILARLQLLVVCLPGGRERRDWDVLREDGLVLGGVHLVLGGEIQPELAHLEHTARLLEVRALELLVDDPTCRSHPLHVPGSDDVPVPHRVAMLHLAVERDGDGLESPVRVLPHPAALVRRRELLRRGVVEHQPRRELLGERAVVEHGEDVEPVPDPVPGWRLEDLSDLLAALFGSHRPGIAGGDGGGGEGRGAGTRDALCRASSEGGWASGERREHRRVPPGVRRAR